MPLFKFKKNSSKKVPLKSSSMGSLYKDYGGEAVESNPDKRSSWDNVASNRKDDQTKVADLHAKIEDQAAQLNELKQRLEKQDEMLRDQGEERNLLLLKTEVLIDMLAYKTAENQALARNNTKLKGFLEKRLQSLTGGVVAGPPEVKTFL